MAIKLEGRKGGGGKALVAWPLVDELFFIEKLHKRILNYAYSFKVALADTKE